MSKKLKGTAAALVDQIEAYLRKLERSHVPSEFAQRAAVADVCGKLHAARNLSDPFAYRRAHSRVMNGLLGREDFDLNIGDC